ncbi:ribosomal protein S18-alanine N-acetyltransferase [Marinobacter nanhaiticus D15-8W]|uniref:[Ribosomal protein bS18]-alanine N-acetyltransferase n=1 Tax=Marinobacter nanhaiticus D15-8W TaxID=626887 RepID=N6W2W7_9GAMM|nr:ribosomal protein S18-alanine N-acetyltransferase [Marinobacter nanhaiticus]ENO16885.1 ribosomal-protein-alanine N-acetyltransferase [Marinobacter nanhaiticus D15-8W]BES72702.1 ribosomal protein S18-alanine N-acetyltransferase [Marinobacter nanhaiticus D15-8W]
MPRGRPYVDIGQLSRNIRPLEMSDLDHVLEIERGGYSHPWSERVFRDCFRPDYRLWAHTEIGELQAYAVVAHLFDEAHLLNFCVGRAHRNSGVGRQLLRFLVRAAFHEGMVRLILEVRRSNEPAIALYESEGFQMIGERPGYYPGVQQREDALVFALDSMKEH